MSVLPRLFLLLCCLWPLSAAAQGVTRCMSATGEAIYTDKRCEDVGATDRLPSAAAVQAGAVYRAGCSRTLSDLVAQINGAVAAGDVNRLSSIYLWNGVSNASANRILDQLEKIVARPLVDIVPVRPRPPPVLDQHGQVIDDNRDGYYPHTQPQRPIALRLEQTLANGSTPASTTLGLRRSYGCFWITL
ncbi:hypothetical protein [Pseudoxanthomonas mexicana]|uniref:hypothetical protein n=1 Tax=Pseudoxanthomonas mexicana TaxID=128785 RepID=UPI00398AAF3B